MVKNWFMVFVVAIWLPAQLHAAQFTASIDRQQLSLNERVTLTLSLRNSDLRLRAEGVDPTIDISPLHRDFDVGVPQPSNYYNIYQGRGRSTSELRIALYPKRTGKLTIPSFSVDGLATEPLHLEVLTLPADSAPEVFVRSGSNIKTMWEGQQLVVFLDIYHRVELKKAKMADILETEPTRIELMPHWQLPQDKFQSEQFGFDYEVQRLAWALFPDTVGPFSIYLPSIEVTTSEGRELRFPHQQLNIDIQPLPPGVPKDIIIGKPDVSYTRLPTQIRQHQLSSWTITLRAPVAVGALPNYLPQDMPSGETLKVYPDRAVRETFKASSGIIDQATYTFSLMPLISGDITLPPLYIPYFDPQTGTPETIAIPKQDLVSNKSSRPLPSENAGAQTNTPDNSDNSSPFTNYGWQLSSALFAALWLITLAYFLRPSSRKPVKKKAKNGGRRHPDGSTSQTHPRHQLLKALGTRTLAEGLEKWRREHPAEREIGQAIVQIQRQYYGQREEVELSEKELINLARKIEQIKQQGTVEKRDSDAQWLTEIFRCQKTP